MYVKKGRKGGGRNLHVNMELSFILVYVALHVDWEKSGATEARDPAPWEWGGARLGSVARTVLRYLEERNATRPDCSSLLSLRNRRARRDRGHARPRPVPVFVRLRSRSCVSCGARADSPW